MNELLSLFVLTIKEPDQAAERILAFNAPRSLSWTALALASVLNTIVMFLVFLLVPDPEVQQLVELFPPVLVAVVFAAVATISAIVLAWSGKVFGGRGAFDDVLAFITWLQFMRLAVLILVSLLMFVLPNVATMINLLAWVYGVWIVLNFQNVVQGFDSLSRSGSSLLLCFFGIVAVMSVFISFFGLTAPTG